MTKLAFIVASFAFTLLTACMTGEELEPGTDLTDEELALQDEMDAELDAELDADGAVARQVTVGDETVNSDLVIEPGVKARACGFSTDRWGTSRWKNCTSKHVTVRVDARLAKDLSVCVKPDSTKTIGVAWGARGAAVTLNGCI